MILSMFLRNFDLEQLKVDKAITVKLQLTVIVRTKAVTDNRIDRYIMYSNVILLLTLDEAKQAPIWPKPNGSKGDWLPRGGPTEHDKRR
ncbi:hypothetical protein AVEN_243831-1 [Araneus ventricosus]|uniref:Uncharacterized protein n=1 Tax=Araneus ventricosus TaxID=182803 RepID=A0A4Y2A5A2_ARAVE|nr:hypothetical protein AVEN_243831-1 [Araneus ventricosus]